MCGLCGALGDATAWERDGIPGAPSRWLRRREADETARRLTAALATRRVRVASDPAHGFIVSFPTGGQDLAPNLGAVWHALARRGLSVPDPLAT